MLSLSSHIDLSMQSSVLMSPLLFPFLHTYSLSMSFLGCKVLCININIFQGGLPRCLSSWWDFCCRAWFWEVFPFVWATLFCHLYLFDGDCFQYFQVLVIFLFSKHSDSFLISLFFSLCYLFFPFFIASIAHFSNFHFLMSSIYLRWLIFPCDFVNLYPQCTFYVCTWVVSLLLQIVMTKLHLPGSCLSGFSLQLKFFLPLLISLSCFSWLQEWILWFCQIFSTFSNNLLFHFARPYHWLFCD